MKRFYCTVCKRVKRVQKWPRNIDNQASTEPTTRVGECNRHHYSDRLSVRKTGTR